MAQSVVEMLSTAEQFLGNGHLDRAEELCRGVLQSPRVTQDSTDARVRAQAHRFLGLSAYLRGRPEAALEALQQSLALAADEAAAHDNLALILLALCRPEEAEAAARQALALQPKLPTAAQNLGLALLTQDRVADAEKALGLAVALDPRNAGCWNDIGTVWMELGWLPEARAAFERALELKPDFPFARQNLDALPSSDRASSPTRKRKGMPDKAVKENNRGIELAVQSRYAHAAAAFRNALRVDPTLAPPLCNLGRAQQNQQRPAAAEALFLSVLRHCPDMAECLRYLNDLYFAQKRYDEAQEIYQRLVKAEAAQSTTGEQGPIAKLNQEASILFKQGRHREARAAYENALALAPDNVLLHSNMLFHEQYHADVTLARLAQVHADFERRHALPLRSAWRPFTQSRDPDRPLRLGFVSGDFRFHPVGIFIAPLLDRLDPREWHTVCYTTNRSQDNMSIRLAKAVADWRQVAGYTDEFLAETIRTDGIDLLFDLSGHTASNRLLTFARRPAPLQFTWAGYVGTTGLSAIDYLIADRFHVPADAEQHYREKILRLPNGYICYEPVPPEQAGAVSSLPALRLGRVTFGCFNNPGKITQRVVATWSEIMRRVPASHMLLKYTTYDEADVRERLLKGLADAGIAPDRIEFQGMTALVDHMKCYNSVDLALDTFPYSGGITTCEACWMGVPVVTCPGETFASRHSLSHMSNMGIADTIVHSLSDYVEKAVELACDLPRLAALRAGLREQMARSPLCDQVRYAENFAAAMRQVWRKWCAENP